MNKKRRTELNKALTLIQQARELVETCREEEEEYKDNMPESLQSSEKYELAEQAVENLEECAE